MADYSSITCFYENGKRFPMTTKITGMTCGEWKGFRLVAFGKLNFRMTTNHPNFLYFYLSLQWNRLM